MKPVLVLKQDGMAVQLGPIQVPLGQRDSNLFYSPGVTRLKPTESFYSRIDPETKIPIGPQALDIDHDAERLAQLGVNVDLAMTPERRRGTMRSRQEKYESKMPLQERIARNLSSQLDPTDKAGQEAAFQQALDRTGLGANIGRYASYGLGGLAGLMALQRANESGTDLFSALGSAGTTGYLTQRQLQPALQRLGMRAAGKTLSPPVGENLSSSDLHTSAGATPPKTGAGTIQDTLDVGIKQPTVAPPTVAPPTTETKPQTDLYGNTLTDIYGEMGEGPKHTEHGEMSSAKASPSNQSSIDEKQQQELMTLYDDFERIYDAQEENMRKGNRRSFVGVR